MSLKQKTAKRLFSQFTLYSLSLVIAVLSLLPIAGPPPVAFTFLDKLIHLIFYLLLSFTAVNTFILAGLNKPRQKAFFYAFSLGLLLEVGQHYLPFRSFELADIAANLSGSLIGVYIIVTKFK